MRNLLYACLAASLLMMIWSCTDTVSESEQMESVWKIAQEHRRQNISMSEDTLLPRALKYFRDRKDTAKLLDSYLLEMLYYKWNNCEEEMFATIDSGINCAVALRDTTQLLLFYRAKAEMYYFRNKYHQAIDLTKKILTFSDKLSASLHYALVYRLSLNLALVNDPEYNDYFEQSIDMATAAKDTASAVHFIRNLASVYSATGKYNESNKLLHRVMELDPLLMKRSLMQIEMAYNFINLRRTDSARHYLAIAQKNEKRLRAGGEGNFTRQGMLTLLQGIQNYVDGTHVSIMEIARFCDSLTVEMGDKQNTITQQLETRNKLQRLNHELFVEQQRTQWRLMLVLIGLVAIVLTAYFYIRNRYKRLAEAEDRIDTLMRILEDTQKAPEEGMLPTDGAFFKKLLLQQLGIIRLVANTPTAQNCELLKRISGISSKEVPVDSLLVWDDLYPVIDRVYGDFYTRLTEQFGAQLTEKEVQICCLLCAGFSTKEIGVITQQSSATIYVRKSTIRKKIGVPEGEDIIGYLEHA